MNIIKMKVDDLLQKKAEYNPRVELQPGDVEYEKLKKSISEFGYVSPIIYNTQRQIIVGGHQRLSVLKDLGYDEVDVVCVDLDETREKALNIALNKVQGFWDEEKLNDLLTELSETNLDFELTGFNFEDLEVLSEGLKNVEIPENLDDFFREMTEEELQKKKEIFIIIGNKIKIKITEEELQVIEGVYKEKGEGYILNLLKGECL